MLNRFYELDAFRGISALAVMLYHYTTRYNEIYTHKNKLLFDLPLGHNGVRFFFIISGFVILMSLERTRKVTDFFVARFSRLFPPYWVAIFLTFTIVSIFKLPGREVSLYHAIVNLTMIQKWLGVQNIDGLYWFLAVQLSFYVIMSVLYKLKLLKHIELIGAIWITCVLLDIVINKYTSYTIPHKIRFTLLLEYANLFVMGFVLYNIKTKNDKIYRWLLLALALFAQWCISDTQTTIVVFFILIIIYLAIIGFLSFIVIRPLLFLGTISYSLYLIHQNIGYVIIYNLEKYHFNSNFSIIIAITFSMLLASLMTFVIEKNFSTLIKNYYYQKKNTKAN